MSLALAVIFSPWTLPTAPCSLLLAFQGLGVNAPEPENVDDSHSVGGRVVLGLFAEG